MVKYPNVNDVIPITKHYEKCVEIRNKIKKLNLTITEPGVYIEASIISGANEVSASRNEVLNPFSSKVPNYISGSRNVVRQLGSYDTISLISGGRYNL
jgi:hypothetical protein